MNDDNYYNTNLYKRLDPLLAHLNVFKPDYHLSHKEQKFDSNNIEEYVQLKSTVPFFKGGPTNYKLFSRHLQQATPFTKGEKLMNMRFIIRNYKHNIKEMKANKQNLFSIPKPVELRMFKCSQVKSIKNVPKSASMPNLNNSNSNRKVLRESTRNVGRSTAWSSINNKKEKTIVVFKQHGALTERRKLSANDLFIADYDMLKYKKSFMFDIYKKKYEFYVNEEDAGGEGGGGCCNGMDVQMRKTMKYFNKKKKEMFEEEPQTQLIRKNMQELRFKTIKRKAIEDEHNRNEMVSRYGKKSPLTVD